MTVLVVESDPAVNRVMVRLLESEGLQVIAVSGAREAVALLSRMRGAVKLIAAEWEPPDMAGREFLACIARLAPGVRLLRLTPARPLPWTSDGERRADPAVAAKPFRAYGFVRHVRAALALPPINFPERRVTRVPA